MKKLFYLFVLGLLISCGASKTVRTSKKVIKGGWTLTNVNYDTQYTLGVSLFNDASAQCFESSSWNFIPNNNTGNYSLSGGDCPAGTRNFIFTIQEVNAETGLYDFLLKPVNEKGKSATNAGFRLELTSLTETSMQWLQTVNVDGKPFSITMNFIKQ